MRKRNPSFICAESKKSSLREPKDKRPFYNGHLKCPTQDLGECSEVLIFFQNVNQYRVSVRK